MALIAIELLINTTSLPELHPWQQSGPVCSRNSYHPPLQCWCHCRDGATMWGGHFRPGHWKEEDDVYCRYWSSDAVLQLAAVCLQGQIPWVPLQLPPGLRRGGRTGGLCVLLLYSPSEEGLQHHQTLFKARSLSSLATHTQTKYTQTQESRSSRWQIFVSRALLLYCSVLYVSFCHFCFKVLGLQASDFVAFWMLNTLYSVWMSISQRMSFLFWCCLQCTGSRWWDGSSVEEVTK